MRGKKSWASAEQKSWLEKKLPEFVKAQQDQTIGNFLSNAYAEFHTQWPSVSLATTETQDSEGVNKTKANELVSYYLSYKPSHFN